MIFSLNTETFAKGTPDSVIYNSRDFFPRLVATLGCCHFHHVLLPYLLSVKVKKHSTIVGQWDLCLPHCPREWSKPLQPRPRHISFHLPTDYWTTFMFQVLFNFMFNSARLRPCLSWPCFIKSSDRWVISCRDRLIIICSHHCSMKKWRTAAVPKTATKKTIPYFPKGPKANNNNNNLNNHNKVATNFPFPMVSTFLHYFATIACD